MSADALKQRLAVARGDAPADLVVRDARVVNVFTGEIQHTDVAIHGGVVAGLGADYVGRDHIQAAGRYLAPGLIDAHVHVESAMVPPRELSRALVPRGVTTIVTDPHEIANVLGLDGIRFMLDDASGAAVSMFVNASSCVPATHMETSGAELTARDLMELLREPSVLGLAELMNFPGVIQGSDDMLAKILAFAGRPIDGHAPRVSGKPLNAYIAAGPSSDHEATTPDEALEKARLGMTVFIREATNARNLAALMPVVTTTNARRFCFCTDDRQPADLLDDGSIDHLVRMAIDGGMDPVEAIRMATLNPAEHFGLRDRGAIGPGRRADFFLFTDLQRPMAEVVVVGGHVVAAGGAMRGERQPSDLSRMPATVRVDWDAVDLKIRAFGDRVRVIGVVPDQLVTEHLVVDARIVDGFAHADPGRDLAKMAVIERHGAGGTFGLGFVSGMGLRAGAIAGTVAHDHHNLVIIGADDVSMRTAGQAVTQAGGGLAAADGDRVLGVLPLPIAGLMSDLPIEEVRVAMDELIGVARRLGSTLHDPYMAMSFLALEVIPALKLTDLGLVDVEAFQLVPLFVDAAR